MVAKFMVRLARKRMADPVVRWWFGHLAAALPVGRVASTPTVLAFRHPRPWRETHILLVPKSGIASLLALEQAGEAYVSDIFILASELSASLDPGVEGPRSLIVNGGAYQEVGQLHFHLVAGPNVQSYARLTQVPAKSLLETQGIVVFDHPNPVRETHLVLQPVPLPPVTSRDQIMHGQVHSLIETTKTLVRQRGLDRTGFSLIVSADDGELDFSCFHLVAGRRSGESK